MMAEYVETRCEEDPTRVVDHENGDQEVPSSDFYDLHDPDDVNDGEVPSNCPSRPMSDAYVQSLNAAKPVLQKKVLVGNILPKLLNSKGGFLDDVERGKVESGGSNQTKMHFLLEILKTKDDVALTTFCKVLEDSKYVEAAEKLKKEIASRGHLLTSSLGDCPSEIELQEVSKIVGKQWESLLVHLGVPAAKTESLFQDYLGRIQSACFHGLVFWREGNEPCRPATWSVLLDALEKGAELKEYADCRRSELLSLSTACQAESLTRTHKVLREKNVALSLSPLAAAVKKLNPILAKVFSHFRHHVTQLLPKSLVYNEVRSICQTTIASKAGVSSFNTFHMPLDVSEFAECIIKEHTTFYDIKLIHEVADLLKQPTLTEAVVRYEAILKPLMVTSIAELTDRCEVTQINQDSPEGTYRLVLKFPDDTNVKNLYAAKDYLEKVLHIPEAKLLALDFGCILIYFEITCPPDVLKDLPKKFTKHSSQLQAMGISGAFLIDHWAWGADSDDVWYTDDESDDMEVNEQQGFLENRKRSHFVSVSGGCAEIVPSKKASHLKESCPTEKESGDRQGTAEEDCCSQPSHPPMPCTEETTSLGSEPVLQIKHLKEEMSHQFEQLQTSKRVLTNHPNVVKFMGGQSMAAREILKGFKPAPSNLIIGRILNRGSYGVIYHGMLGGEPVAVKRIHRILLEADVQGREHLVRAFKNECRYLKPVNHPNVVKLVGAYRDKEGPLLVMELMKESLEQFLKRKRGKLSLRHQLDICYSIAKGLAALHNHAESILHRDLTDRNVLLAEDGTVKIADFGQSKMINKPAQDLMSTQPGAVTYMPPEVLEHNPRYTSSIDTFSLGVLMLEIATQQPPQLLLTDIGTKPEIIRRAVDLEKLDNGHRLKPLILWCLQECDCRPLVATICCQISILRDHVMMKENELNPDERRELEENVRELRGENHTQVEKNRQLLLQVSQLQREKEREMQRLQENVRELRGEKHTQVEKNRQLSLQVSQLQENVRELRGEKHTQVEKNRQLSLQVSQLQREKDSEIQQLQTIRRDLEEKDSCIRQLQKRLSDEEKVKEELHEESLMNKQIIEQYRADFEAERKDRQEAAGKFADREKEWMEQIRRIEEERDHLQKHLGYRHDERLRQESQTLRAERQHFCQTTQELQATQDTCKKLSAEKKHLEYQLAMNGEALHTESQHNERLKRENQTLRAEVKDTRQCSLQKIQDLQEQMEKQKMEINWLKLELSNRQKDARKSKSRYTSYTHIYDRNEQEHSATSMKTERTTSQRIQKLEEENQTLEYQVKYTGQALQEKENLCKELQKHNKDLRSILNHKNTWTGWVGTLFGSS